MFKIELFNLQFHSFHGVHEEETKTGGNFEVNLVVFFEPETMPVKHLHETIDYTKLYAIIKQRMEKPTRLLETLATEIADKIMSEFLAVDEIAVAIKKLNPPIPFFSGSVSVEYKTKRKL